MEVNPFNFNEDNLKKIVNFTMILPRRLFFKFESSKLFEYSDYQIFYEGKEDSLVRIEEIFGSKPTKTKQLEIASKEGILYMSSTSLEI